MPDRLRYVVRSTDATSGTPIDRRSFRRNYVFANAYEFWIGLAAVISSLTFFIDPSSLAKSIVGSAVPYAAAAFWNGLYLLGGVAIVAGIWRGELRLELAGLSLLSAGIVVNAMAAVIVVGPSAAAGASSLFALAGAGIMRAWLLVKWVKRAEAVAADG